MSDLGFQGLTLHARFKVALAGELPDSDPCHLNYHLIYFITIFFHTCRVRWENAGLCLLQKLGPMGMGVEVWVG